MNVTENGTIQLFTPFRQVQKLQMIDVPHCLFTARLAELLLNFSHLARISFSSVAWVMMVQVTQEMSKSSSSNFTQALIHHWLKPIFAPRIRILHDL
jgi:hypothetical protein